MIRLKGVDQPSTINVASSIPHGTYHMADNPHIWEPQRNNNFEFVIPSSQLENLYIPNGSGTIKVSDYLNVSLSEALRLAVKSTSVPHFQQNVIPVKRGNSTFKFAGTPTFGSDSLVIHDFIGAGTKDIINAWQAQSYNSATEKIGLGQDYKKLAWLQEYTPDWQLVRSWKLYGCWISNVDESAYDTDDDGKRQMNVTIEYDHSEIDYADANLLTTI